MHLQPELAGAQHVAPLQGTILALAAAGNFLFAGCQDCSIKVWALNAETKGFSPVVSTLPMHDVQPSDVLHVRPSGCLVPRPAIAAQPQSLLFACLCLVQDVLLLNQPCKDAALHRQ